MIYAHYSEAPWDARRWPNFTAKELSCPCCGEYYHDEQALDALQAARKGVGAPFNVNSAHRCAIHNAHVGGAPLSQHKRIAFDISLRGHDRERLKFICHGAGFTGFGHYGTFLHIDMGRPRWWASNAGRKLWKL